MKMQCHQVGKSLRRVHPFLILPAAVYLSSFAIQLHAQPAITSFSPTSGQTGSTVVITGSGFQPDSSGITVYFGAVKAAVKAASANSITVEVPAGASYHPVLVTVNGLTANTGRPFIPVFPGGGAAFVNHSFAPKIDLSAGNFPLGIAIQDFDGDGIPDLAAAIDPGSYQPAYACVLRNTGSIGIISFPGKKNFFLSVEPDKVRVGDINGDGKQDMVVATRSNLGSTYTLRNSGVSGNVNFDVINTGSSEQFFSQENEDIQVSDIDRDGKPDLIVAGSSPNAIFVYRNISNRDTIDFEPEVRYPLSGFNTKTISVADLDGDGRPEIIFTRFSDKTISIIQNKSTPGTITLTRLTNLSLPYAGGPISIQDLDNDGKPELAVANYDISNDSTGQISIFKNRSTPDSLSFALVTNAVLGGRIGDLSIADMDGDSIPDLVATDLSTNQVAVFKNAGKGTLQFSPKVAYGTGSSPQRLVLGDLDGDGKPEIVVSNYVSGTISVLRNQVGEALVAPSGTNPVGGTIINRVTIDPVVQSYKGAPYVQRHYDIEPQNASPTATARITMLFLQQEFDNFNAFTGHGVNLPGAPGDAAGKAALRMYQYHGNSVTGTPGTYSGTTAVIDPDDTAIVWNPVAGWWEVSFDVAGFSGFFVSSAGNTALPVQLLDFTATRQGNKVYLQWHTDNEVSMDYFQAERSNNNQDFTPITTINAGNHMSPATYTVFDTLNRQPICYYRLKMVDKDGSALYSSVVSIRQHATAGIRLDVFPNPAGAYCTVNHPVAVGEAQIQLTDGSGRIVKIISVAQGTGQTIVNLYGMPPGVYRIIWNDKASKLSRSLMVKQP